MSPEQKTIFLTVFEGVEGKNLLRTDVVKTLLADPSVRLVLLFKTLARVRRHIGEFSDDGDRVSFEVIDLPPAVGLDRFFQKLKFLLLRTESTPLWRRAANADKPKLLGSLLYHLGETANFVLARSPVIRLARRLDFLLVKNDAYASLFMKYCPDLVFCANLFDEREVHLLREAKKRRVKTVGFVNSWDRTTSRSVLRLLPDKMVVWNEQIKKDLAGFHLMPLRDIFVSGVPQYDYYFRAPFVSRDEFFRKIGADPARPLLVYAPFGLAYSAADWQIIKLLSELNERGSFGNRVTILVRCPPNDVVDRNSIPSLPDVIYEFPGERFSERKSPDWDMTEAELRHLADTVCYMDLMIAFASSISIEAAILDKPIININFNVRPVGRSEVDLTYHYGKRHYRQALATGGIRLVGSKEELAEWVRKYLANSRLDRDGRRELALKTATFLDDHAGERVGKFALTSLT